MTTPNFILQVCGWLTGIPLEVLVIFALIRGPYRQFPLVLLYTVTGLFTTVVEMGLYTRSYLVRDAAIWRQAAYIYWIDEWVLQIAIFAMVLSLIDRATTYSRWRRVARTGLSAGAFLFAAISLAIHYRPAPVRFGFWMTPWTRDLSFCATILDLALWMMLIAARKRDKRMLLISGALGLQFTGEAMGAAIRDLAVPKMMLPLSIGGSTVALLADLGCLYLWWQAFRPARQANLSQPI